MDKGTRLTLSEVLGHLGDLAVERESSVNPREGGWSGRILHYSIANGVPQLKSHLLDSTKGSYMSE
jgi:hypothetical protein